MPLSIVARLRDGRYDAADERPSVPEWPPHPARVFCALVASAAEPADWTALQWLERAGSPEVWASPVTETRTARAVGYVVTNATEARGGSQTWPGRSNGFKQRVGTLPADGGIVLVWPEAEPDDATLGRLVRLARRVPYLGRSTSTVELTALPEAVAARPAWTVHRPARLGSPGAVELRVAYPGYADALRDGYEHGQRPWNFSRTAAYLVDTAAGPADPVPEAGVPGPYSDLLVWGFARTGVRPAGDRLLAVTRMLRRAVISRVPDPVPPLVSGHSANGRPHVAYLGLVHVDHEYADGQVLGVGVAVPRELPSADRHRLVAALLDERDPLAQLRLPWGPVATLDFRPERTAPWGLVPERWTAAPGGARTWVTATPVMLDRYPRRGEDPAALVAGSLVTAGYPEPVSVEPLPAAAVLGATHRPRKGTIPDGYPRRPWSHCRVEFPEPVVGPVIAGALRYLGFGLLIPHRPERSFDDGSQ